MKTVILAGGLGTRLAEYTQSIPKPMVDIGGKPILQHIMQIYSDFAHKDFVIALGYKGEVIKEFFLNLKALQSDLEIDLGSGSMDYLKESHLDWKVRLVDTGEHSMTGGRIKRLAPHLDSAFMATYGDGVADIDVDRLLEFHRNHGKLATVTAVRPPARFGELQIGENGKVESFLEKPQIGAGWINGGFFVFEPEVLDFIENDQTVLEKEPLERLAKDDQLMTYQHEGFWMPMDTVRDRNALETKVRDGDAPWIRSHK
jgi:glucose-1-phosphate cytidylyltransferase